MASIGGQEVHTCDLTIQYLKNYLKSNITCTLTVYSIFYFLLKWHALVKAIKRSHNFDSLTPFFRVGLDSLCVEVYNLVLGLKVGKLDLPPHGSWGLVHGIQDVVRQSWATWVI